MANVKIKLLLQWDIIPWWLKLHEIFLSLTFRHLNHKFTKFSMICISNNICCFKLIMSTYWSLNWACHLAQMETSWNYNFSLSIKYQVMELRPVPVTRLECRNLGFPEVSPSWNRNLICMIYLAILYTSIFPFLCRPFDYVCDKTAWGIIIW